MNDDLCFPYFPSSLSLSPPPSFCPFSTRHTACCAHGITADRSLFDQLVMLFLLKIGGREIGGASIPTTRPPIRIIFPFIPLSLSRFTHNVTPAEFIFSTRSTLRSTGIELRGRVMTFRLLQIHYNYRGDSSFDGNLLEILGRYSWNVTWDKLNAKKKKKKKKQGKKRKEGRE